MSPLRFLDIIILSKKGKQRGDTMERKMYMKLKRYKHRLTKQQYTTIKGQIKKGEYLAADKGLNRLLMVS